MPLVLHVVYEYIRKTTNNVYQVCGREHTISHRTSSGNNSCSNFFDLYIVAFDSSIAFELYACSRCFSARNASQSVTTGTSSSGAVPAKVFAPRVTKAANKKTTAGRNHRSLSRLIRCLADIGPLGAEAAQPGRPSPSCVLRNTSMALPGKEKKREERKKEEKRNTKHAFAVIFDTGRCM